MRSCMCGISSKIHFNRKYNMNELKFNSQICTTKEQSQRLLDLGLKPETADMAWVCVTKEGLTQWVMTLNTPKNKPNIDIPAWSLHRLMEILDSPLIEFNTLTYNPYEGIIDLISECLKLKRITNKEYLKQ